MFGRARLKLAAWYGAALALTVLAIALVAYFVVRDALDGEVDDSLRSARTSFQSDDHAAPPGGGGHPEERSPDPHRINSISSDVFFITTTPAGAIVENMRQVNVDGVDFAALVRDAGAGDHWADVTSSQGDVRLLTFPVDSGRSSYLHLGRSLSARDSQLRTLILVLIIAGGLGVIVSGAVGLWLAGRALRPIRSALEAQQRFVSDASHELRTPISVVRANNELLLRHTDQQISANLDHVEAIAAESDHMTHLVEDLLTLARADEGRVSLARESLDVAAIVEGVVRDMTPLAEQKRIRLTADVSPSPAIGDRQRLRQLAVILLDNAIKYSPEGSAIDVRCHHAGRRVVLSIADHGPGIPVEAQHRIFDRFVRVDSARSRAAGGTGLGLAIARWIAEAHHGRVSVESSPGNGSTFTVRLPAE